MNAPAVSVILPVRDEPRRLRPTLDSIRRQSVACEVVCVVPPDGRAAVRAVAPDIDALVEVGGDDWTPARALNAGASTARCPAHATVLVGHELPRADWLERLLAHLRRPEVAGASGARWDRERGFLLEARDVPAAQWSPTWGFSTAAGGWKATAWARWPFPDAARAAEDRIWAWDVLRGGQVLVVDPFLALDGPGPWPVTARSILRRTAEEWASLVSADTPVTAPTLRQALASWWNEVEGRSATPAALQRLNYFRLARALGRWEGGRRAGPRRPS